MHHPLGSRVRLSGGPESGSNSKQSPVLSELWQIPQPLWTEADNFQGLYQSPDHVLVGLIHHHKLLNPSCYVTAGVVLLVQALSAGDEPCSPKSLLPQNVLMKLQSNRNIQERISLEMRILLCLTWDMYGNLPIKIYQSIMTQFRKVNRTKLPLGIFLELASFSFPDIEWLLSDHSSSSSGTV